MAFKACASLDLKPLSKINIGQSRNSFGEKSIQHNLRIGKQNNLLMDKHSNDPRDSRPASSLKPNLRGESNAVHTFNCIWWIKPTAHTDSLMARSWIKLSAKCFTSVMQFACKSKYLLFDWNGTSSVWGRRESDEWAPDRAVPQYIADSLEDAIYS